MRKKKTWRYALAVLLGIPVILIPLCFMLNHMRMQSFRRHARTVPPEKMVRDSQTPSPRSGMEPGPRRRENSVQITTAALPASPLVNGYPERPEIIDPVQSSSLTSAKIDFILAQSVRLAYDTSHRNPWQRLRTRADKYFMIGYVGLLKGVEAGVWACGGSLPDNMYLEIGMESLFLGDRESAANYLRLGMENPKRTMHRDYFTRYLAIAEAGQ